MDQCMLNRYLWTCTYENDREGCWQQQSLDRSNISTPTSPFSGTRMSQWLLQPCPMLGLTSHFFFPLLAVLDLSVCNWCVLLVFGLVFLFLLFTYAPFYFLCLENFCCCIVSKTNVWGFPRTFLFEQAKKNNKRKHLLRNVKVMFEFREIPLSQR